MNKELTPLEALEFLGDLEAFTGECEEERTSMINELPEYKIIETTLKNYEKLINDFGVDFLTQLLNTPDDIKYKKLKALEIIKEKDVDVGWLKRAGNLYHYNMGMGIKSYGALTEGDYDLLKEVLL